MHGLARERGLFLMEAVWTRMNPVYRRLTKMMEDGELGEVFK